MFGWFSHKCFYCENKVEEPRKHVEVMPTLAGDLVFRYCNKCWEVKSYKDKRDAEYRARRYDEYVKEREVKHQYEVLEEKIHREELRRKAKELGIEFDG